MLRKPRRKHADQLLPLKPVAVELEGRKQIIDPTAAVRQVINRREAEKFYREVLGWPTSTFDCVN